MGFIQGTGYFNLTPSYFHFLSVHLSTSRHHSNLYRNARRVNVNNLFINIHISTSNIQHNSLMEVITPPACGPPPPTAVYPDPRTAFTAIQAHAKGHGYAVMIRDTHPNKTNPTKIIYACDRGGKAQSRPKNPNIHPDRQRKGSRSKKCGCDMRVALKKDLISSQWELHILDGIHNHPASADPSAHPAHRIAALDPTIIVQIESLVCSGLSNAQILAVIRHEHSRIVLLAQKDISNLAQKTRLKQLNGKTPMEWLFQVYLTISIVLVY